MLAPTYGMTHEAGAATYREQIHSHGSPGSTIDSPIILGSDCFLGRAREKTRDALAARARGSWRGGRARSEVSGARRRDAPLHRGGGHDPRDARGPRAAPCHLARARAP